MLRLAVVLCITLALSACGTAKTRVVVEHTTTVVRNAGETVSPGSEPAHTSSQSAPELTDYTASLYSAKVPSNWTQEADDVQKGGYRESKWRDPAHPQSVVLIDATANDQKSAADSASDVNAATSQTPGYSEVSSTSTTLAGQDAWQWDFNVSGTRRVDYFRNDCGTGVAVLGVAAPSDFDALDSTFRQVAESVSASCSTSTSTDSSSTTSTDSGSSSSDFCSTHSCIPNFPNGTGYIVQCNDGMWSHSGGRPGACSGHGGESGRTYP